MMLYRNDTRVKPVRQSYCTADGSFPSRVEREGKLQTPCGDRKVKSWLQQPVTGC
jgi:hypothetical protein